MTLTTTLTQNELQLRAMVKKQFNALDDQRRIEMWNDYVQNSLNGDLKVYTLDNVSICEAFNHNLNDFLDYAANSNILKMNEFCYFYIDRKKDLKVRAFSSMNSPDNPMFEHMEEFIEWLVFCGQSLAGYESQFNIPDIMWRKVYNGSQELYYAFVDGELGDLDNHPSEPTVQNFDITINFAAAWYDWFDDVVARLIDMKIIERYENNSTVYVLVDGKDTHE